MMFQKKIILFLSIIISIVFNLTLGIAFIALFLRPKLDKVLSRTVTVAFYLGIFLLGITITLNMQAIIYGIILGILAVGAQVIATILIARNLSKTDKLHLAFAQYNGITSIGLGIFFQHYFPHITSYIAFAVITINSIYYLTNNYFYKFLLGMSEKYKI